MSGFPAVIAAFVVSIVAHFAVGAVKSLITIRSWWASGLEMTIVGVIEASSPMGSDWPSARLDRHSLGMNRPRSLLSSRRLTKHGA